MSLFLQIYFGTFFLTLLTGLGVGISVIVYIFYNEWKLNKNKRRTQYQHGKKRRPRLKKATDQCEAKLGTSRACTSPRQNAYIESQSRQYEYSEAYPNTTDHIAVALPTLDTEVKSQAECSNLLSAETESNEEGIRKLESNTTETSSSSINA